MDDSLMVLFVSGVDGVQRKEVVSAVSYPMMLIPVLTRPSMRILVSDNGAIQTSVGLLYQSSYTVDIERMTIALSGSPIMSTAGGNGSLVCSAMITTNPRPDNIPSPTVEWFFGPNSSPLPSSVITTPGSNTLQFSPLNQSHAGMYTCRLVGSTRLVARTTLIVNGMQDY